MKDMTKYEYKVIKTFTLLSDKNGEIRLASNEEEVKHGSSFLLNSSYVDYKFVDGEIDQDDITDFLIKNKFITLISQR